MSTEAIRTMVLELLHRIRRAALCVSMQQHPNDTAFRAAMHSHSPTKVFIPQILKAVAAARRLPVRMEHFKFHPFLQIPATARDLSASSPSNDAREHSWAASHEHSEVSVA